MTAHDPRVTLTEADENLLGPFIWGGWIGVAESKRDAFSRELRATVERIAAEHVAAHLALIRALEKRWRTLGEHGRGQVAPHFMGIADDLRNALDAPQDAPRRPVGGEQGAEVAGGRSEGERGCECPPDWPCHSCAREPLVEVTDCHHMRTQTFETVPPHTKCLDCGAPVERRGWTWVCDGCMKTLTYSEVADWADGEHVLCETCNRPDGACFR